MQDVQEQSGGLRARKREATRRAVRAAAFALFHARGFEAVTLDDIAAAAEVSRRSLFHHFRSKEDIVFSAKGSFEAELRAAVAAQPAGESVMRMAEGALKSLGAAWRGREPRALAQLIHDTPILRAGDQAKYESLERGLAEALAERAGLPSDALGPRMAAVATVGVLRVATECWLASPDDGEGPLPHGEAAFAALREAVCGEATRTGSRRP